MEAETCAKLERREKPEKLCAPLLTAAVYVVVRRPAEREDPAPSSGKRSSLTTSIEKLLIYAHRPSDGPGPLAAH